MLSAYKLFVTTTPAYNSGFTGFTTEVIPFETIVSANKAAELLEKSSDSRTTIVRVVKLY